MYLCYPFELGYSKCRFSTDRIKQSYMAGTRLGVWADRQARPCMGLCIGRCMGGCCGDDVVGGGVVNVVLYYLDVGDGGE